MRMVSESSTIPPFTMFTLDGIGNWKGEAEIPDASLEDGATRFKGEDKTLFLEFVRKMVKWKPEERSSARELFQEDAWLNRP